MTENWFVMVSEWMEKGNINEFLKADTKADRLGLVRLPSETINFLVVANRTMSVA